MKKKLYLTIFFSIILGIIIGTFRFFNNSKKINVSNNIHSSGDLVSSGDFEDSGDIEQYLPTNAVPSNVRAVYSTGWVAGTKNLREAMIKNIVDYGYNAIVVDIKDEGGNLSYKSNVQTAIDCYF